MYFCLVFSSPLTCSLIFYYLAPVDRRTGNLVMRTIWRRNTHTHTRYSWKNHTLPNADACRPPYTGFQILYTWTHDTHTHKHSWRFWCTLANVERRMSWITTTPNDYFMSGWEEEQGRREARYRVGFSKFDSPYFISFRYFFLCHLSLSEFQGCWLKGLMVSMLFNFTKWNKNKRK